MAEPTYAVENTGDAARVKLGGRWTLAERRIERSAKALAGDLAKARAVTLDLGQIESIDTAGAWLIDRCRAEVETRGGEVTYEGAQPGHAILLEEARWREFPKHKARVGGGLIDLFADIGKTVSVALSDVAKGVSFFGEVVAALLRLVTHPGRFRFTSFIYQIESFGFRSLPIIALINFLVGCIVAQQGLFQLRQFGAATFAVDLIGILVLRELAVLLTSIMIAGRSGSAITAELGSMKMREEIDALRVMGLDPIEVLVVPRLLALLVALPLLTFLADMAAIFGGLVVTWGYGGISPETFMARLRDAIALNTFLVGLIKAPFMALVIAVISTMEGMSVEGSAESLGRQVTQSVVKSIFMVIVVDGLFAMFFATISY